MSSFFPSFCPFLPQVSTLPIGDCDGKVVKGEGKGVEEARKRSEWKGQGRTGQNEEAGGRWQNPKPKTRAGRPKVALRLKKQAGQSVTSERYQEGFL
jgi:hypothetical protein